MNTTFEITTESKQLTGIEEGANFKKLDLGKLNEIKNYTVENKDLKMKNNGKVFLHELLGLTGAEISINSIPAGVNTPFKHKHKENEEVYIILSGTGIMHIDNNNLQLKEGSVVKVSTQGVRAIDNTGSEELILICIQTQTGSLKGFTLTDAEIV